MTTAHIIRQFIVSSLSSKHSAERLSDDVSLLDERVLDSLTLLQLVLFLEGRFGIQVTENEMSYENFRSVNSIVSFVDDKRGEDREQGPTFDR